MFVSKMLNVEKKEENLYFLKNCCSEVRKSSSSSKFCSIRGVTSRRRPWLYYDLRSAYIRQWCGGGGGDDALVFLRMMHALIMAHCVICVNSRSRCSVSTEERAE